MAGVRTPRLLDKPLPRAIPSEDRADNAQVPHEVGAGVVEETRPAEERGEALERRALPEYEAEGVGPEHGETRWQHQHAVVRRREAVQW